MPSDSLDMDFVGMGQQHASLFVIFQAADGIRDCHVAGVQTCALPISVGDPPSPPARKFPDGLFDGSPTALRRATAIASEIGRASCRESVYIPVDATALERKWCLG